MNLSDMKAQQFSLEVQKLKALDQINLEIFQRLEPDLSVICSNCEHSLDISSSFCPSCGVHLWNYCTCEVVRMPSRRYGCCFVCKRRTKENKVNWETETVDSIVLDFLLLEVATSRKTFAFPSLFSPTLAEINLFNDPLPPVGYQSLAPLIQKYTLLDPEKGLPFVTGWKNALEEIQIELGKVEKIGLMFKSELDRVKELCKIEDEAPMRKPFNPYRGVYKRLLLRKGPISQHCSFHFDLRVGDEAHNNKLINSITQVIDELYG